MMGMPCFYDACFLGGDARQRFAQPFFDDQIEC